MSEAARSEDVGAAPAVTAGGRGRAVGSLLWTMLESGGLTALSLLTLIAFAHLLTPAELGSAALGLSIVQILGMPVFALFHEALVQRRDAAPVYFDTAFTASFLLGLAFVALCWWQADAVGALVEDAGAATALRWMSLGLPVQALESVLIAKAWRELRYRDLALRSVFGRLGGGLAAIALAVAGLGIWAPIAQQVLSSALSAALLCWTVGVPLRFRCDRGAGGELLHFGLRALGTNSLVVLVPRLFLMQIGMVLGTEAAGYANLAFRMVDTLRDVLVTAIWRLSLPVFSRLADSPRLFRRALSASLEDTSALVFPFFAGLAAVAPDVIVLVFGAAWVPALSYTVALCVVALIFVVRTYLWIGVTALARPHYPSAGLLAELAVVLLWVPLASVSPLAAPLAWTLRALLALPLDAWMLQRASGIGIAAQLRGVPALLLASAAMGCAVTLLGQALPGGMAPALRLAILVPAGALLYALLIMALNPAMLKRLLTFARAAAAHVAAR